jgi:hypothetical protein
MKKAQIKRRPALDLGFLCPEFPQGSEVPGNVFSGLKMVPE